MSAQIVLFFQLGLLFVNCILLIVSLTVYFSYRNNKKTGLKASEHIILEAQDNARQILENAVLKAKQVISETNYVQEGLFKDLEAGLQKAAQADVQALNIQNDQLNKFYIQLLNTIKSEHLKKTDEVINSVNQITQAEMLDFKEILKKETIQAEDLVTKRVNNEYIEVHKQLEQYRQQRMSKIDNEVHQMILKTTESILGKTIPIDEHEKLIIQALEEAKAEGLFSN